MDMKVVFEAKKKEMIFASAAHKKFYKEELKCTRKQDVYHQALCYCLGINKDTRDHIGEIYDFKTGYVNQDCLHEEWQTSESQRVVRMAFNLYCNGIPGVYDIEDPEEQLKECHCYTVEDLFRCAYAPFFWQAIQIRYPEYVTYHSGLYDWFEE